MGRLIISATSLNLMEECPLCFYLKVKEKIDRPRPPTASITFGMDRVIKNYFEKCRDKGILPPFLKQTLGEKKLAEDTTLNLSADFFTQENPPLRLRLLGKLDECLVDGEGKYYPLDHKTRGFAPGEDTLKFYKLQMNIYTLLLEKNGFPTAGKGYLVFYYPEGIEVPEWEDRLSGEVFQFAFKVKEIDTSLEEATQVIWRAIRILRRDTPPNPSPGCAYCNWRRGRSRVKVVSPSPTENLLF